MITTCISGLMSMNLTFYARSVFIYSVGFYNKYPVFICTTLAELSFKCHHILYAMKYEIIAF
jgi:hypothetical protein